MKIKKAEACLRFFLDKPCKIWYDTTRVSVCGSVSPHAVHTRACADPFRHPHIISYAGVAELADA